MAHQCIIQGSGEQCGSIIHSFIGVHFIWLWQKLKWRKQFMILQPKPARGRWSQVPFSCASWD